jgi:receptor protein-tyrosine kinase
VIIRDILSVVRRRWWVLVLCVVIGGIAGGAAAMLAKPAYTSNARILVATPHIDQGAQVPPGGITTQQRTVNYAALVTGSTITQKVIDELHLTEPMSVLLLHTHVSVISGTTIIQISVDDPEAAQAQRIAHAFATALVAAVPTVDRASGEANSVATVTLTDDANLPPLPATTSRSSNIALGIVAGLVVGALLIWLMEYLDRRLRDPRKLAELSGGPVLGVVYGDPAQTGDRLITSVPANGPYAESYRTLRTALQFVDIDGTAPIFTMVGARAGTGTTTAAANIAASMAQAGQRTLLVDADLHRSHLAELLGLPAGAPGLSEVLAGTAEAPQVTQRWAAGEVDVIAAGSPPRLPTEQVQSSAMDELLAKVRDSYDVVIVDSPPLGDVTDGALLAAATDGAILVARYGFTTDDDVAVVVSRLSMVRSGPLGSVMVDTPRSVRLARAGRGSAASVDA